MGSSQTLHVKSSLSIAVADLSLPKGKLRKMVGTGLGAGQWLLGPPRELSPCLNAWELSPCLSGHPTAGGRLCYNALHWVCPSISGLLNSPCCTQAVHTVPCPLWATSRCRSGERKEPHRLSEEEVQRLCGREQYGRSVREKKGRGKAGHCNHDNLSSTESHRESL